MVAWFHIGVLDLREWYMSSLKSMLVFFVQSLILRDIVLQGGETDVYDFDKQRNWTESQDIFYITLQKLIFWIPQIVYKSIKENLRDLSRMGKGLEVINAIFPKTGTKTVHEALRILGYEVCDVQEVVYRVWYHFANPLGKPTFQVRNIQASNFQVSDFQARNFQARNFQARFRFPSVFFPSGFAKWYHTRL